MLKEFKSFALRGNVLDLAVGFIMGAAFNAVVSSLVEDVMMNVIATIVGKPDFSELRAGAVRYGSFLTALVNFLLVALALFLMVKVINRVMRPKGAAPEPPTIRECPYCMSAIPLKATRCSACTSEVKPPPA